MKEVAKNITHKISTKKHPSFLSLYKKGRSYNSIAEEFSDTKAHVRHTIENELTDIIWNRHHRNISGKDLSKEVSKELNRINQQKKRVVKCKKKIKPKKAKSSNNILDKNHASFLRLYISGESYASIAKNYNITRERVRQIIYKEIEANVLTEFSDQGVTLVKDDQLKAKVKKRLDLIKQGKRNKRNSKKDAILKNHIDRINVYGIDNFKTISELNNFIGKDADKVHRRYPQIFIEIRRNRKERWSEQFSSCKICRTTQIKHQSNGYCANCYARENAFDGNREKTIQRDNEECILCHLSREDHKKMYGKDLYVHRKFADSNDLENLVTLCNDCHFEMNKDNYDIL